MKILNFPQLLVADAPIKKSKKIVYPLSEHFWDTKYKNKFWFCTLIKKSSYKPSWNYYIFF